MLNHLSTINLDISEFSLKATRLYARGGDIYLGSAKRFSVPKGAIAKGRIQNKETVAASIKEILEKVQDKLHHKERLVNLVLPDTATFVKLIEVESSESNTNSQIAEVINKELGYHIPYSLDDVYLDWQIIEKHKGHIEVLAGVCPREIVEEYSSIIHLAGFVPKTLEIECLPITRAIFPIHQKKSKNLANKNIIVVDLGEERSSIIFYREKMYSGFDSIEFSVSIPFSGKDIDALIQEKLHLSPVQATTVKFRLGIEEHEQYNDMLKKALEPLLNGLIGRLRESIEFHETHFHGAVINSIVLCGGGANLRGLCEYITNALGIAARQADPLINIKNKKYITAPEALGFCTAIGLGLKDFYI